MTPDPAVVERFAAILAEKFANMPWVKHIAELLAAELEPIVVQNDDGAGGVSIDKDGKWQSYFRASTTRIVGYRLRPKEETQWMSADCRCCGGTGLVWRWINRAWPRGDEPAGEWDDCPRCSL